MPVLLAAILILSLGPGSGCTAWTSAAGRDGAPRDPAGPPVGRDVVERLRFPPLRFDPPIPERFELSNGVTVFFLRDQALPLIELFVHLKGGFFYVGRDQFAAGSALPSLMRNGGTARLSPEAVDEAIELNALGVSTSSDGARITLSMSGLGRQLDLVAGLWSDILLRPRFDSLAVEEWRIRELEAVRRVGDFPGSLAVIQFNRILYGDHPIGWVLTEADLEPGNVTTDRLRRLHTDMICPEGAVIGAAGDITRAELRAALERALADWAPCGRVPEPPPPPTLRQDRTVYVIPTPLEQSSIVVGQPGGVLLGETSDYFASRVANWVIGGSGFTSRLVARLRTQEGLAYSAASVWGTARAHPRIFGAITHTRSETTVPATLMVLETLGEAVARPPDRSEVDMAKAAIINGFVFGFDSSSQVVARQVAYLADGFPPDWFDRYLQGIRGVDSAAVARVLRRHVDPAGFTVLIVGDTAAFDPSVLGPVHILP